MLQNNFLGILIMSKPGKSLKRLCKRLKVRLTVKRNGKRVYKSVKVLKAQCDNKKKKVKKKKVKRRRRKFGTSLAGEDNKGEIQKRVKKRDMYLIGEMHMFNYSAFILDKLIKYLKDNKKTPYIFSEHNMVLPIYKTYLTTEFGPNFTQNNVKQIDQDKNNAVLSVFPNMYLPKITSKGVRLVQDVKIGTFNDLGKDVINLKTKSMSNISSNTDIINSIKKAISNKKSYDDYKIKDEKINTLLTDVEYENFPNVDTLQKKVGESYEKLNGQIENLKKYMPSSKYLGSLMDQYKSTNRVFFSLIKQNNEFRNSGGERKKFITDSDKFMYINKLKTLFKIQDTPFWTEKDKEIANKATTLNYDYYAYNEVFKDNSSAEFFNVVFTEAVKMRDENLKGKIDKVEKDSNDNNPFIVYVGEAHIKNYEEHYKHEYNIIKLYVPVSEYSIDNLSDVKQNTIKMLTQSGIITKTNTKFGKRKRKVKKKRKVKRKRKRKVKKKRKRKVKRKSKVKKKRKRKVKRKRKRK